MAAWPYAGVSRDLPVGVPPPPTSPEDTTASKGSGGYERREGMDGWERLDESEGRRVGGSDKAGVAGGEGLDLFWSMKPSATRAQPE